MSVRDLILWGRNNGNQVPSLLRDDDRDPFLSLHREVNRLFDGSVPTLLRLIGIFKMIEAELFDEEGNRFVIVSDDQRNHVRGTAA